MDAAGTPMSAEEVLSRVEEASGLIINVSVTEDQWSYVGSSIEAAHTERIYAKGGHYVKSLVRTGVRESLYYQGAWFYRGLGGAWEREDDSNATGRHARLSLDSTQIGTNVLRSIAIAGSYLYVQGQEVRRLEDEVVDGKIFLRLRSTFRDGKGTLTQDFWIDAKTFVVHRVRFEGRFDAGGRRMRSVDAAIEYSGFNESELPGPLPER